MTKRKDLLERRDLYLPQIETLDDHPELRRGIYPESHFNPLLNEHTYHGRTMEDVANLINTKRGIVKATCMFRYMSNQLLHGNITTPTRSTNFTYVSKEPPLTERMILLHRDIQEAPVVIYYPAQEIAWMNSDGIQLVESFRSTGKSAREAPKTAAATLVLYADEELTAGRAIERLEKYLLEKGLSGRRDILESFEERIKGAQRIERRSDWGPIDYMQTLPFKVWATLYDHAVPGSVEIREKSQKQTHVSMSMIKRRFQQAGRSEEERTTFLQILEEEGIGFDNSDAVLENLDIFLGD